MANVPTFQDFDSLRNDLIERLNELKELFYDSGGAKSSKQWLRSSDVKQMLGISHGKLQKMRDLQQIKHTRIDGIIFYRASDVEELLKAK